MSTSAQREFAIHDLTGFTGPEAYSETQVDEKFKDGDILNLGNGNVGILVVAWPVVVNGDIQSFHRLAADSTWEEFEGGKYAAAALRACQIAHADVSWRLPDPTYADQEVLGVNDGVVVQWDAESAVPYLSGKTLAEFGVSNLSEREFERLGVTVLVNAIEQAGFAVSGPTDSRVAENGEPPWVCNARLLVAKLTQGHVAEHDDKPLPHQVSFATFCAGAIITPLLTHGRAAEVFFGGQSCGFVDVLGIDGLRQAHRSKVNNALYANTKGAPECLACPLPTEAVLREYPELVTLHPEAAAMVLQKDVG